MSSYYWTLGPISFQNGSQVISITEPGIRVFLTDSQAASLQGLIAPISGPFDNPVYPLGTPTSGNLSNCTGYPANQLVGTLSNTGLANPSITVAGTPVALGGTITLDQITALNTLGLIKRTAANTFGVAVAGTDYQSPLQSPVFNVQTTKTANYTASISDFVPVSALAGSIVVTLPTAPADQSRVAVKKMDSTSNTVSIAIGGSDVINQSGTATLKLAVQYQSAILQYSASQSVWYVVSTDAPLGQLDSRYLRAVNLYYLDNFGADPTGSSFSDTALAAAMTAMGSNPGQVVLSNGATYKFANSYVFGPKQGMMSTGRTDGSAILNYTGNGVFIHAYDSSFDSSGGAQTYYKSVAGEFVGFTIDGTSAGASAVGFEQGDLWNVRTNVQVRNFTGASAKGFWFNNTVGWTENGVVDIRTSNCTTHVCFDVHGSFSSFDRMDFRIVIDANPNQVAALWLHNAQQLGGSFTMTGNFRMGVSNTGAALKMGTIGDNTDGGGLLNVLVNVDVEVDGSGVGPISINRLNAGTIWSCFGSMAFHGFGGNSFQNSVGCGSGSTAFSFSGSIHATNDTALGDPTSGVGLSVAGALLHGSGYAGGGTIYAQGGDFFAFQLASGANTYAVSGLTSGKAQSFRCHIQQPSSGAAGTLTLTGATWAGSSVLSTANNAVDVVDIWTLDGVNVYASIVGGLRRGIVSVTGSVTLANIPGQDLIALIGAGGAPTLPTAVANGNKYTVKNIDTTSKILSTTSSQTIDGVSSLTIAAGDSYDVISDGSSWRVI